MEQHKSAKKPKREVTMGIGKINPMTPSQVNFFANFHQHDVIALHGAAGTGKTYIALYRALKLLASDSSYNLVRIIRSDVAVRSSGFLPGSLKDKLQGFEAPYEAICSQLYGRGDAYSVLKQKRMIEFTPTTHLRGMTFNDQIIIVDECQNMSFQELNTILTRFGTNCKLVLIGDAEQDDLTSERYNEKSGFKRVLKILSRVDSCYDIEFTVDDIVRSGFVKQYLIAKSNSDKPNKKQLPRFLLETAKVA